jgi:D-alanyl-D-alanine carboxypeptidase/D-alanyl-D-alanine-endopeptidase (penicillin-binding protein 4)
MSRTSFSAVFLLNLMLFTLSPGRQVFSQANETNSAIRNEAEKIAAHPGMFHAAWSVVVLDAKTGEIVYQVNPQMALTPASIQKLIITYPAWKSLGPDFRFKTLFQTDGTVKDSTLQGNLYIKGDGDPTFGTTRIRSCDPVLLFDRWMNILKKKGIREVEGGVIADADVFTDDLIPGEWMWNDIGNYYGAGATGLNFHENSMDYFFDPAEKTGDPAKLKKIDPMLHGLEIDNKVTTGPKGSGDQVIVFGSPFSPVRLLRGTVPLGEKNFNISASFPDPPLAAAQFFSQYLKTSDIIIHQEVSTTRDLRNKGMRISQGRYTLDSVYSPRLHEIIQWIHHRSINTYSEGVLKKLGQVKGSEGSTEAGLKFVMDFWKLQGLDVRGINLYDGSGLSPLNRISAMQMARIMLIISRDRQADDFVKSMSLAGKSGDLKGILQEENVAGKLYGKSGYMKTVRAYSGIVNVGNDKDLVFAVIVNNFDGESQVLRRMLERLMQAIVLYGE